MRLKVPLSFLCIECEKSFVRYRRRGSFDVCSPCQNKKRAKDWKAANPDRKQELNRSWAEKNSDKNRQIKAQWSKRNLDLEAAKQARRRSKKLKATPSWANHFFISQAYELAQTRTKHFGFAWHVDHVIPLQGELVCGLHVENNLQVIPWRDNIMKSNHFEGNA